MYTSIGFHTFVISKSLTQDEADRLFNDFKRYRDNTKEIYISSVYKYDKDPLARHYEIKYIGSYKGIWWKIRLSDKGFWEDDEFKPCSIKAVINPKTLIGEKSYIVAANSGMLEDIRRNFDQEAAKISPILRGFNNYSLNRIDYCINFDVSELNLDCPVELTKELPKLIMELIKCGDIPNDYNEVYKEAYQFYLKSDAVVINCYWKYAELNKNFPDCKDLKKSYDIIRFEVQHKYPKVMTEIKKYKQEMERRHLALIKIKEKQGNGDSLKNRDDIDRIKINQLCAAYREDYRLKETRIMENMLSDEKCTRTIDDYFCKIVKRGNYYTFKDAKRIIDDKVSGWQKADRLTDTLKMVRDHGGIAKAKGALQGKELEDFRRSLRELAKLEINPVTIPKEWGIEYIPNLLDNYFLMRAEEQRKEKKEKEEMFFEYVKDCRKKGIPL